MDTTVLIELLTASVRIATPCSSLRLAGYYQKTLELLPSVSRA